METIHKELKELATIVRGDLSRGLPNNELVFNAVDNLVRTVFELLEGRPEEEISEVADESLAEGYDAIYEKLVEMHQSLQDIIGLKYFVAERVQEDLKVVAEALDRFIEEEDERW